jgi:thymidine kinase
MKNNLFKRVIYDIIIGPTNSGKTTLFLLNSTPRIKKILVSVVKLEKILPLDMSLESFEKYNCNYVNLKDNSNHSFDPAEQFMICVDEIHFFEKSDLIILENFLKKFNNPQIYFTMLTQSDSNSFLNNTKQLFINCNDILLVKGYCINCNRSTQQSAAIKKRTSKANICNKQMFNTMCKNCKIEIN